MNRAFSLSLFVSAAACTALPENPSAQDPCRAGEQYGFIGQHISAVTLPDGVRSIGPDTIQTYDYVPSRLNVQLDADGTITGFYCG